MARPRQFDPDTAIEKALETFWEKGYAGASTRDLCEATGLHPGSLYQAFGSKAQLFELGLERYIAKGQEGLRQLLSQVDRPDQALRLAIEGALGDRRGCFVVNCSTEQVQAHPELSALLQRNAKANLAIWAEGWKRAGYDPETSASLAQLMNVSAMGLQVLIRGNASQDQIEAALDAIAALVPERPA